MFYLILDVNLRYFVLKITCYIRLSLTVKNQSKCCFFTLGHIKLFYISLIRSTTKWYTLRDILINTVATIFVISTTLLLAISFIWCIVFFLWLVNFPGCLVILFAWPLIYFCCLVISNWIKMIDIKNSKVHSIYSI